MTAKEDAASKAQETEKPHVYRADLGESIPMPEIKTDAPVKPADPEDLDALSKDELVKRAAALSLTVKRADGEDGEPLVSDYVSALKKAAKKAPKP